MPPKKEKESSFPSNSETAVALFGKQMEMLPEELKELGLGELVTAKEVPGVSPTWKPAKVGDFLLGKVVQVRENIGKFQSTALIMETVIPGGFRTVFLGADLKIKLGSINPVDRVYSIYYDGVMEFPGGKQPMKVYRVYEVIPKQAALEA